MTDRASTEGLPLREGHIVVTLPSGEQYYDPPIPDRASAEGLRETLRTYAPLVKRDGYLNVDALIGVLRPYLRDTGPRPDSGIDATALAEALSDFRREREQYATAPWGTDEAVTYIMAALRDTGPRPDSGIDVLLLEDVAVEYADGTHDGLLSGTTVRLSTPRTEEPHG